jgi:hypothetical protein
MNIANQIMASTNPLIGLLGDYKQNLVGYVYSMNFNEALILTNDAWKAKVGGIPHYSFLVASAFDPERFADSDEIDREVILLRVLGQTNLPQDADLLRTRIEHNQRRTPEEIFTQDAHDGMDPITHSELQYGGLKCRILGTFYMENGNPRLGSDIENFMSSTRLRVFKPRGAALGQIVNHINPEILNKAREEAEKSGFKGLPGSIRIGTVRYTSTARMHRGLGETLVPVMIQPSDFLSRRTAVFGMTRTGKSNTVKTTVASVHMAAMKDSIKVGQIIFDLNGEYANANHQDDGSSIAEVFGTECVRYRAIDTPGFEDLRTNFYTESAEALNLISKLSRDDPYRNQTDLEHFLDSSLEEPDSTDQSAHKRWEVRKVIFQCILHEAGYKPPSGFGVRFPVNQGVLDAVANPSIPTPKPAGKGYVSMSLDEAREWFVAARNLNYEMKNLQKDRRQPIIGLSTTNGNPWIDSVTEAYLNVLARANTTGTSIRGYRAIVPFVPYHSPKRSSDVVVEVLGHLLSGKIVILDLFAGPVAVKTVLAERIARHIFDFAFTEMNAGKTPQNIVMYVEEAHNLIGKKEDLIATWPRIAKEGAKARIAFVYATQEPSSIHPNIMANTENWFVTHLNNDDELRALGKFYDFADFHDSLKNSQDVGFARIKTLSSPFIVPPK